MFEYRFIRFYFDHEQNKFIPIVFDCKMSFQALVAKYKNGMQNEAEYRL